MSEVHHDGLEIAVEGQDSQFSAIEMLIASLGLCTISVLLEYGETIGTPTHELSIGIRWSIADKPHRVATMVMRVEWPGLAARRVEAIKRAVHHCTVHNTLLHAPSISTEVQT